MNRGGVWWVDHPDTGRRPYLVMTRRAVIPMLRSITAAPATTRVRGIPSEVPLCALSPVRMVQACRALAVAMGC